MTGYGMGSAELAGLRVTIELRTVNNRFVDLRLRLPQTLAGRERDIRRRIQRRVRRGRVEFTLNIERIRESDEGRSVTRQAVVELIGVRDLLRQELDIKGEMDLATVLSAANVLRNDGPSDVDWGEAELGALDQALENALEALDGDRAREGEVLRSELLTRLQTMAELSGKLRQGLDGLPATMRDKLIERLSALAGDIELDPARVAQEALFLADRTDVTEELVRLDGHLDQASHLLREPDGEPVGKRLEFLLQEIHRETNTVNSKPADLGISRIALALKTECEKVREQIQNLE